MHSDNAEVSAAPSTTSPDPSSLPIPRLSDTPFRDLIRSGWRVANEVWFAAVLAFLIYAPPQITGVAIAILVMDGDFMKNPAAVPPWQLIAMGVYGLGNCFWIFVVLFGLPWVKGAAAARIRERLVTPDRRHTSFTDAGNRVYGRVLVLTLIEWLLFGACAAPSFVATQFFVGAPVFDPQDPVAIAAMNTHPVVVACNVFAAAAGAAIAAVWLLCISAVVIEDQGLVGAIQRGVGFVVERKRDAWRLCLLSAGLALPAFLAQQGGLFFGFNWTLVAVTALSVAFTVYVDLVLLGVAIALYLDRRQGDVMPTLEPTPR